MTPAGPRRVLMLSHHEGTLPAGAPLADRALAGALAELGYEVDLLFYEDVLPGAVRGTWRQLAYPWAAALAGLRRHRRVPYDVVEATAGDAWALRALLRDQGGTRPLFSIRSHGLEHRRAALELERWRREGRPPGPLTRLYHFRWRLREVARDLRAADAVFLLNGEDARWATDHLRVLAERVHVLPNGLPRQLLCLTQDEAPDRCHALLFLGAWTPAKGADLLPAIARRVFAADPRFRLTCAGTQAPAEEVLAAFAPDDRARLRVLPRYDPRELPAILRGHGVFVFPSPAEGCSLALLEAVAGRLVPVVVRTGWAADALQHGHDAFLLEAGDAEGFARAILSLAADPGVATRMGRAAHRTVAGASWMERARERAEVWQRLLEERDGRG